MPDWSKTFVCSVDPAGKRHSVLFEIPGPAASLCFKYSSAEKKAVVVSGSSVWVVDLATRTSKPYEFHESPFAEINCTNLELSPDGREFGILAYTVQRHGRLWRFVISSGHTRFLPLGDGVNKGGPTSLHWATRQNILVIPAIGKTWIVDPKSLRIVDTLPLIKLTGWTRRKPIHAEDQPLWDKYSWAYELSWHGSCLPEGIQTEQGTRDFLTTHGGKVVKLIVRERCYRGRSRAAGGSKLVAGVVVYG